MSSFTAPTRPNYLVIISDDQGFGDFGFTGNQLVQTPNIDRLADEASEFFEAVKTAPIWLRPALFKPRTDCSNLTFVMQA